MSEVIRIENLSKIYRMGDVEVPGRPFIMAAGGWQMRRPAPLLGQHTAEVLREVGLSQAQIDEASGMEVAR